jgi:hypothetical protein
MWVAVLPASVAKHTCDESRARALPLINALIVIANDHYPPIRACEEPDELLAALIIDSATLCELLITQSA